MQKNENALKTFRLIEGAMEEVSLKTNRLDELVSGVNKELSCFLIGAKSASEFTTIIRVTKALSERGPDLRRQLSEDRITELLSFYLEGEERAEVDIELERDNAVLRADYIKTTETYTAAEIRSFQSGSLPKNPSDPAARWKREKRVFAIPYRNSDLFPAFQFSDGEPAPVIKKILQALPNDMSVWQTAFWFASANGWLDGKTPAECLSHYEDVIEAARRMNESAIG